MSKASSRGPPRDPRQTHSVQTTVVGAVLASLLAPAIVLAAIYPVVAVGVVALAVAAWPLLKSFRRLYRARRRRGQTRQLCVPKTPICAEV